MYCRVYDSGFTPKAEDAEAGKNAELGLITRLVPV
jgi:hypothetical protein